MFEHKDRVKKFLRYMNLHHRNIQFACEEESNDKVSFLDISITRSKNKLVTSLYRKKTFRGAYISHNSFLPTNYKKDLIDTLFRSYNICADYSILHNNIKCLKTIWQKNSFPLISIDNSIKQFLNKLFITRKSSKTILDKKEIFIYLKFSGKIYLQSKKLLIDIFITCRQKRKLNVSFRSWNKIRNAFRFMDQIPIYMNSSLIYKYKCNICNDVYIGETKRHNYEHLGR